MVSSDTHGQEDLALHRDDRTGHGAIPKRAIVVGAFSYPDWWCTFGDVEAMLEVRSWLEASGIAFDIACHPQNGFDGVDIHIVDPSRYTIFIYVCGPWNEPRYERFFGPFSHCVKIGVNVTVLNGAAHGFDLLYARDLGTDVRPDLALVRRSAAIGRPVVGLCLVHPQEEYGERQRHALVGQEVMRFCDEHGIVALPMDTVCYQNTTSTRSIDQFDALAARTDYVITSRLHGLVLSLRAGVPAIAIDPIAGGGKVTAQARALEWPLLVGADDISVAAIAAMAERCRYGRMDPYIAKAARLAVESAAGTRSALIAYFRADKGPTS